VTSVPTDSPRDKTPPPERGAAYRDAWLDELWAPVREYRPLAEDREAEQARRDLLAAHFGDQRGAA
jgi:hypothetical protein